MIVRESLRAPFRSLRDELLTQMLKNAGLLLTGNGLGYALGLLSLALAARALGPELLGTLVLVNTYVFLVDAFFNFQSWQALIKFGAEELEKAEGGEFKSLVKFGLLLDASCALLSTVLATLGVALVGPWLGWDAQVRWMATLFSLVILSNLGGTPTAILRLFGKFRELAAARLTTAAAKATGAVSAFVLGGGLWGFLLAWMGAQALGNLLLLGLGLREMARQRMGDFLLAPVRVVPRRHEGFWSFLWTTNLHSSIRLGTTEVDTLIVGGLLGPASTGVYKVVKQFSSAVGMLTGPLHQVIYPDLSRLWSAGRVREFKGLVRNAAALVGSVGLFAWGGFFIFGSWLLKVSVGPSFSEAYMPILIFTCGVLISAASFPYHPAMLAMGHPGLAFRILFFSTAAYLVLLALLSYYCGLIGSTVAYLVFYVIWVILSVTKFHSTLNVSLNKSLKDGQ